MGLFRFWGVRVYIDGVFSMCREILNTCVRNTEEAERASKGGGWTESDGEWYSEESELAKSIRLDGTCLFFQKKIYNLVNNDICFIV